MIIVDDFAQGSPEWFAARAGIPTASCFGRLVTPGGKFSTQIGKYSLELAAERLMGKPAESFTSDWMKRGQDLEADARSLVMLLRDANARTPGLVYADELRSVACSPDLLYFDSEGEPAGGCEVKCPSPHVHLEYLMDGGLPSEYLPQVQGSMFVTGLDRWDFCSYHPDMPPLLLTVKRDERWIDLLRDALFSLHTMVEGHLVKLRERGVLA